MKLVQVLNGIYSPHEFNPNNRYELVIAVHPFYKHDLYGLPYLLDRWNEELIKKMCSENPEWEEKRIQKLMSEMRGYTIGLTEMLASHKGPWISFDGEPEGTAERYYMLGRKSELYFIKTSREGVRLTDANWPDVLSFLGSFKSKSWRVIGGYYTGNKSIKSKGCLDAIVDELRRTHGLIIKKDVTF